MCGRYALTSPPDAVRAYFGYVEQPNFPPRHDIRPTQPVAVMRLSQAAYSFALMRWGFIPGFVKDEKEFPLLINARSETVFEKPSFRNAIRRRRCLFLADGFYEWQKLDDKGKKKQPYLIRRPQQGPLAMAGIFERWMSPNGSELDTCAILTTSANATMSAIHDRMPVILSRAQFEPWLSPDATVKDIENLMRPLDDDALELVKIDAVPRDEV
ncbi:MAG: SOS response-associated peptidase [Proteobacteria bacterium]|nr:SOS response-associated peptidase [Pseudomonadota bacterium]